MMETEPVELPKTIFSDKVYNILKWVVMLFLPALGSFYFALAGIWHLPYAEQVAGTVMAVTTFLGVMLGISTIQYQQRH